MPSAASYLLRTGNYLFLNQAKNARLHGHQPTISAAVPYAVLLWLSTSLVLLSHLCYLVRLGSNALLLP